MSASAFTITVTGAAHDVDAAPVSARVESAFETPPTTMREIDSGRETPCQWAPDGAGGVLTWIERGLRAGETRVYRTESRPPSTNDHSGVRLTESPHGLDVLFGDGQFTSYNLGGGGARRPYLHPVVGPGGETLTRNFPMVAGVPGETVDHPHHRGIWLAHGDVNSVDNWSEGDVTGFTLHRAFRALVDGPVYGRAVAEADWVEPDGNAVLLRETRDMTFYDLGDARAIDLHVSLTAAEQDALFGDTKEAAMVAVRVASTMDEVRGGRVENADGAAGEAEVFGRRSPWCDYSGPVGGRTLGIALFDHPANLRHPTNWHARDYGLLGANPFGLSVYEGPDRNGEYLLPAGDTLEFRHRVYVHYGNAAESRVADRYRDYVSPPSARVS